MIQIPLTRGLVTTVDDNDHDLVKPHEWHVNACRNLYYARSGKRPGFYLHRLLLPDADRVEHIDGNGLNNQRSNLRPTTYSQSSITAPPKPGRLYKGVREYRPGRWSARIGGGGHLTHLGVYRTPEEAARVYDRAAYERWGDIAYLNLPEEMCK